MASPLNERCSSGRASGSARRRHRADPGGELARGEGLGHVVVGAELEPDDTVGLLAAGGEHDHRAAASASESNDRARAVRARKHHVEDDEIRAVALEQLTGTVAVCGFECLVALPIEVADDDLADRRLVVDDENGGHVTDVPQIGVNGS